MMKLSRNNDAQLLILTSFIVFVLIIGLGVVSVQLSNINVDLPAEKSHAILTDYADVRVKFGHALYQRLYYIPNLDILDDIFNDIVYEFSNVIISHGSYFDAEYTGITYYYNGNPQGIVVNLVYFIDDSYISEEIEYNIW